MLKLGVAVPAPAGMDFDFNDARPMPFLSAPSTPRPFGACSLSAPTSPPRGAEFHRHFDDDDNFKGGEGRSEIPFSWQERPRTPKSQPPRSASNTYIEDDFAFDLSGELKKASLWADELFDRGKIKPLKPLQLDDDDDSIDQQRSKLVSPIARGRKIINEVFSPRKKKDSDPLVENTRRRAENERGRERISGLTSRHRAARSLSPFRVAEFPWEEEEKEEEEEEQEQEQTATQAAAAAALNQNASISSNFSTPTSKSSSKKWRLRDFLLFRSASEGRASDKDPLRRCQANLCRKHEEVKKSTASFRSTDSESGSVRKRRMSAHELHYKTNKAASNDLKKKTFLPYKQGILGRFSFNPTIHALR